MECSPVPQGISLNLRLPCWLCGDACHMVADIRLDEFTWVDDSGSTVGTDTDLRPLEEHGGAYARLKWLADEMDWLSKLRDSSPGRGEWPSSQAQAEYHARGREYSALKVRLETGGTFHVHYVRTDSVPPYAGTVPRCCGSWAWLRPSGWQCRECGQPVTTSP